MLKRLSNLQQHRLNEQHFFKILGQFPLTLRGLSVPLPSATILCQPCLPLVHGKRLVILQHPGHFISIKQELGLCTRYFFLGFLFSRKGWRRSFVRGMFLQGGLNHQKANGQLLQNQLCIYFKDLFSYFVFSVLPTCMCVCALHVCMVPTEARRGHWIPWDWRYRQLKSTMWVLRTEPESSAKAGLLTTEHLSSPLYSF